MSKDIVLTRSHPSSFRDQNYVYPVLSRRAGGVSIGINLSPHRLCNFNCIYCQVSGRAVDGGDVPLVLETVPPRSVDLRILAEELRQTAQWVIDGTLFNIEPFSKVESEHRALRDFAFSGDGEPTFAPDFSDAVEILVQVRNELNLHDCRLVLITNASQLQSESIVTSLDKFVACGGEIWAKLDAGSEEYYHLINGSAVPYQQILENIEYAANRWGITIQTMCLNYSGKAPSFEEFDAYCDRLTAIVHRGGKINRVQFYTVARRPASCKVAAIDEDDMKSFARRLKERTGLKVDIFFA